MRPQIQPGAPVLTPRRRLGHDRLDADGAQRVGHFFHLPRPAPAVQDEAADHVVADRKRPRRDRTLKVRAIGDRDRPRIGERVAGDAARRIGDADVRIRLLVFLGQRADVSAARDGIAAARKPLAGIAEADAKVRLLKDRTKAKKGFQRSARRPYLASARSREISIES